MSLCSQDRANFLLEMPNVMLIENFHPVVHPNPLLTY